MPSDPNLLIQNDFRPISGRTVLLFAAVLATTVALMVPSLAGQGPLPGMAALYGAGLLAVVVAVLPMRWQALPALAIRSAPRRPIILGVLGTLALSIGVSQIGPEVESMKQMAELVRTPDALAASLFLLAGMAPLVEELIFRGVIYGWIEGRWGARMALPVSAFAFAAAHFEPAYMLLVLPLGFLFSWLRWRTNSLLPSIVAHMANNAFAVLSVVWLDG